MWYIPTATQQVLTHKCLLGLIHLPNGMEYGVYTVSILLSIKIALITLTYLIYRHAFLGELDLSDWLVNI